MPINPPFVCACQRKLKFTAKAKASTQQNFKNFKVIYIFDIIVYNRWNAEVFYLLVCVHMRAYAHMCAHLCIFKICFFILCICVCMSICHICVGSCGGQKRALDSLELKLQFIVSCYVGARELNSGPLK